NQFSTFEEVRISFIQSKNSNSFASRSTCAYCSHGVRYCGAGRGPSNSARASHFAAQPRGSYLESPRACTALRSRLKNQNQNQNCELGRFDDTALAGSGT